MEDFSISVVFNNGESRVIDFERVLNEIGIDAQSPANILRDPMELAKAEIAGNTLSWRNVDQYITLRKGKKRKVPFEIGADVLLRYSKPENAEHNLNLGEMIRKARIENGITQQELARKSGTSRTYISRIENDRSDLEIATLRKIIETGLGRKLHISIK